MVFAKHYTISILSFCTCANQVASLVGRTHSATPPGRVVCVMHMMVLLVCTGLRDVRDVQDAMIKTPTLLPHTPHPHPPLMCVMRVMILTMRVAVAQTPLLYPTDPPHPNHPSCA